MVRRDGSRVRCFTRNGHQWADRFRAIVDAARRIKASSFLIDGEAVIACDDGTPDFHALRSRRRGSEAVLWAFDLIEHDGDDLRGLPPVLGYCLVPEKSAIAACVFAICIRAPAYLFAARTLRGNAIIVLRPVGR